MANLLLDPANFVDGASYWDGTSYIFLDGGNLDGIGLSPPDSTVAGSFYPFSVGGGSPTTFLEIYDGTGVVFSQQIFTETEIVFDVAVTGQVFISFQHDPSGFSSPYSLSASLTPTPDPPDFAVCFWQDVIGATQNCIPE